MSVTGKEQATLESLAALRGPIEPLRDLWPGIEARLAAPERSVPRRRHWGWQAAVASITIAFVLGILLGQQGNGPTEVGLVSAQDLIGPAMSFEVEAAELEYQAAYKSFVPVGIAPSLLGNETLQDIDQSWAALQQAEAALLTALENHPENPYLAQKLLDLRAQQLEFMRHLHMLDQNSRRST